MPRGRARTTGRVADPGDSITEAPEVRKSKKATVADNARAIDNMGVQIAGIHELLATISERIPTPTGQQDEHVASPARPGRPAADHYTSFYGEEDFPPQPLRPSPRRRHQTDAAEAAGYDRMHRLRHTSNPYSSQRPRARVQRVPNHHQLPMNLRDLQDTQDLQGQVANLISANMAPVSGNGRKLFAHSYVQRGTKRTKTGLGELSLSEYNMGFIRLMNSNDTDPADLPHMLNHLEQINQDATSYSWNGVRFWSEEVLSTIAEGEWSWEDTYKIDLLRISLSQRTTIGEASGNHKSDSNTLDTLSDITPEVRAARPAPPCRHYNNSTCTSKTHHIVNGYRYLHICSHCIYHKCAYMPHPDKDCRSKDYKKKAAAARDAPGPAPPLGFGK